MSTPSVDPAEASNEAVDTLTLRVKEALIRALLLTDITPADLADDAPLWAEGGMRLDSVDAIELAVELERALGVRMPDGEETREIYASIGSIVAYLRAQGAR
ncbi:MAG: acyl carrier protein [Deltaproteobacteria bacterium]|nr:acyl carrier protein [Deltaproteobacteria bacterium]MBK9366487.1 acyl carrier protein [Deltaproteobacteria bacterium]